jgi:membrane protein
VAKHAFIIYLNNFANYQQIYGSLASVIILLAWIYFSALILVLGAEFSSEYTRMRRGVPEGELLTPLHEDEERGSEDPGGGWLRAESP